MSVFLRIHLILFISLNYLFSTGQTPARVQKEYTIQWQDEFEGDSLDTLKWNYRGIGFTRQFATVRKENCYLDKEGHLVIETTKEDSNFYVGQIATNNTFNTRYGYFECRAKVNSQTGPVSAFWLQTPTIHKETNDPAANGAEIDIFEYHTREGVDFIHHAVHWNGYGEKAKHVAKKKHIDSLHTGYHTFGLEWTEKKYIFYVDGVKTWQTCRGTSQIPQHMILSIDLMKTGGDFSNSTFPDQVLFDYVRVYKKKEED